MRTMQVALLTGTLALGTLPAVGQPVYQHDTPGGWSHNNGYQGEHSARDEHRADHAGREADRALEHARRDAAEGDYHGADHALRRAQQAEQEAQRHSGYPGRGSDYGHDDRRRHD